MLQLNEPRNLPRIPILICIIIISIQETISHPHLPESMILIKYLNETKVDLFGLYLFDSGSTCTLLNRQTLPSLISSLHGAAQEFTITQGTYSSDEIVTDSEIFFPDFCKSWTISAQVIGSLIVHPRIMTSLLVAIFSFAVSFLTTDRTPFCGMGWQSLCTVCNPLHLLQ